MLDDFSGLEIRRTINGMRDDLPTPPQHPEPLKLGEDGLPVDLAKLIGADNGNGRASTVNVLMEGS